MYLASCNSVNYLFSPFNSSTDILYGRLKVGAAQVTLLGRHPENL
jgi:hypothetical protein